MTSPAPIRANLIGVLVGHTLARRGARFGFTDERQINSCQAQIIAARWKAKGFDGGLIIDAYAARRDGIRERIEAAKGAGVSWAIELHHNAEDAKDDPQDYGAIFYWGASARGRFFADFIRDKCWPDPLRKAYGVQRFKTVALPSPGFKRLAAIQDSPYPAVLLEPAFMSNSAHARYFEAENFKKFAEHLADCLIDWHALQETLAEKYAAR